MLENLKHNIEKAWDDTYLLKFKEIQRSVRHVIKLLDKGTIRVAEPDGGEWKVNEWVKKSSNNVFPYSKNGNH